jgi:hypothetical protein
VSLWFSTTPRRRSRCARCCDSGRSFCVRRGIGTRVARRVVRWARVIGGQRPLGHAQQVEEEHPVGKARSYRMSGTDGERGLPQARGAGDEPHHTDPRRTLGVHQLTHPDQFRRTAGEVVDRPRQFTQSGRTRSVIPQPALARQLRQLPAHVTLQRKRIRRSGHRPMLGSLAAATPHVRQRPSADPRHRGQLLQRQSCRPPMSP